MQPKYIRNYTLDDVGCHADGLLGHAHVRMRLAEMCDAILLPDLASKLRAPMSDDASEEQDAIDALNEQCANTVHFEMVDGDVILFETELSDEDRAELADDSHRCPDCGGLNGCYQSCPSNL